jgi:hypothetical protein
MTIHVRVRGMMTNRVFLLFLARPPLATTQR